MAERPAGALGGSHAVVLAAGRGERFGGGKLLAPLRGLPLVCHAVAAACAAPVETVTVVVGWDAGRVAQAVGENAPRAVRIVVAEDHAEGMGASLRAGVRALPPDAQAVLVFLGDMPDAPHDVAARLLAEIGAGAVVAAPSHLGRRGHPVAFGVLALAFLARLSGDLGARELMGELPGRKAQLACDDPGVLFDIDRPEDLAAADHRPRWEPPNITDCSS